MHGRSSWTVSDSNGLPVTGSTVPALAARDRPLLEHGPLYARHLSLFYRWLIARHITWDAVTFDGSCATSSAPCRRGCRRWCPAMAAAAPGDGEWP